jgi:hypothetical protein
MIAMPKEKGRSPWGSIQHVSIVADGIWFVETAGHGGFKLSRKRQAEMPVALRRKGAWYEEDCEAALVVVGLPRYFDHEKLESATKTVKNWFPDVYEQLTGTIIPLSESYEKRERKFAEDNKDNYVVISAYGDWHQNVPKGMVGVLATKGGDRNGGVRYFLVPKDEYTTKFVIDLKRHKEVEKFN